MAVMALAVTLQPVPSLSDPEVGQHRVGPRLRAAGAAAHGRRHPIRVHLCSESTAIKHKLLQGDAGPQPEMEMLWPVRLVWAEPERGYQ